MTITATVTATNTTLTNTATVGSSTPDPVTSDNSATASFVVPITADLNLTKTITANPAAPFPTAGLANGATYTLAINNSGPDTATNVRVDDPFPPSFTPSSVTAPGFSCVIQAASGGGAFAVVCTRPTLAVADGTLTIAITGTFAASAAGTIVPNGARVDSSNLDPDPASAADTINTLVIPAADLQLQKSADDGSVGPGGTTSFTLTLVNNGPSPAVTTAITDTLPAGLTFVSGTAGCSAAGAVVTCPVGTLPVGSTATATITVKAAAAAAGQTLTNVASASSTTPDPDSSNDQAIAAIDVRNPAADLDVTKTASPVSVDPGGTVTFSIAVENNGPDPAAAAQVTDTLPAGLTFVSASPGCSAAASVVTCTLGELPDETTANVTITASPTDAAAGKTLTNVASASSSTTDPNPADNQSSAAIAVTNQSSAPAATSSPALPTPLAPAGAPAPQPDLVARKTASKTTVAVGQGVTFELGVSNVGAGEATGVTVHDPLPPGLEAVTPLPAGCTATATSVTCTVGTLAAGASRSFPIVVRPTAAVAGKPITNIATAAGDQPDPTPANDAAQATITVQPLDDLSVDASVSPDPLIPGREATYTATIDNHGPDTAVGVELTDALPPGLTGVSATASQGRCTITASGEISCKLGDLRSGGAIQVTIVARVAKSLAGKTLSDSLKLTQAEADSNTRNNSTTLTTRVAPLPDDRRPALAGRRSEYRHPGP